jgi:plastocyanin
MGRGSAIRHVAALSAVVAGLGLAAASAAGVPSERASTSATKRVGVRDNSFTPKTVRPSVGDRVTWTWKGSNPHNVVFRSVPKGASKKPRSATKTSGTFTRKFTKKGTYRYVCTIHVAAGMRGTVSVR